MARPSSSPWAQVALALAVAFLVTGVSWLTAIIQASPIHSDSWWPTLLVWAVGPVVGVVLLLRRQRSWAAAWLLGSVLGVVGFSASVVGYLLANGT